MPDTIRIGVVGAGANTRKHHIPNLKKIKGVEIASVVNRSRASSELSGGRHGDKEMTRIAIPEDKTYRWRVEEEFISAIRGHEPIRRTSFLDAVNCMDFTEAVHISSREGRRVYQPLA